MGDNRETSNCWDVITSTGSGMAPLLMNQSFQSMSSGCHKYRQHPCCSPFEGALKAALFKNNMLINTATVYTVNQVEPL